MERSAYAGLALAVAGAVGVLATELIVTAHARRSPDKTYLIAVSTDSSLKLVRSGADARDATGGRLLVCRSLVDLHAVRLGYECR